jgi:hypothetical protein
LDFVGTPIEIEHYAQRAPDSLDPICVVEEDDEGAGEPVSPDLVVPIVGAS